MSSTAIMTLLVFSLIYLLFTTDKIHRTKITLFGAGFFILSGILTQQEALAAVDWNTLLLLVGMMIIVAGLDESGFFEFVAIKAINKTHGNPLKLFTIFFALTAAFSAFLDNVTTVLLFVPVVIFTCTSLGLSSFPFLVGIAIASNIGGAATLIGDPPNIIIGSAAKLGFNWFIFHITPAIFLIFILDYALLLLIFRKQLSSKKISPIYLDPKKAIRDKKTLIWGLISFSIALLLFIFSDKLGIMPATASIISASIFLLSEIKDPEIYIKKIEWNTLFFFGSIFILTYGLEKQKVIETIYKATIENISSPLIVIIAITFGTALLGCIVGSVPVTAALIPLVRLVIANLPHEHLSKFNNSAFWIALSFGANLGGIGTIYGAAANVVIMGLSQKTPSPLNFKNYLLYGAITSVFSCAVGVLYIILRYY